STRIGPGFQSTRRTEGKKYNVPLSNPVPESLNIPAYLAYTPVGVLPHSLNVPAVRYEEIVQQKTVRPETLKNIIQSQNQRGITVSQQSLRVELLSRRKPVVTGSVDLTTAYVSSGRTKSVADLD